MIGTLRFSRASNWFCCRGGLLNCVAERPISRSPLCCHARQHWDHLIDIVDDENVGLPVMLAMQTADILGQRALPGDGHRQEQRIEPLIVEALANIAPGSKDKPFLIVGHSQGCISRLAFGR